MSVISKKDSACGRCDVAPFCARCKEWALDYLAASIMHGRPQPGDLCGAGRSDSIYVALAIAGWSYDSVRARGLELFRAGIREDRRLIQEDRRLRTIGKPRRAERRKAR